MVEVDSLRLIGQHLYSSSGVIVALFESCESVGGAAAQPEVRSDAVPVDFGGGAGLKDVSGNF